MLLYTLVAVLVPQVLRTASTSNDSMEMINQLSQLIASGIDPQVALSLLHIPQQRLILQFVLSVILNIYQMLTTFGLAAYTLRLSRGQECGAADLFSGFSMAGRIVGQQLVILGLYMLWAIALLFPVVTIVMFGVMSGSEAIGTLIVAAAMIGYVVALLAIMLRYELSTLALADQPELGVMGSIRYAKALIQGYIGHFFVFVLSFFGWMLLCALPTLLFSYACSEVLPTWLADVGSVLLALPMYLWLAPYMNTATAGFYDALQGERS